jgi:hypothetical protein
MEQIRGEVDAVLQSIDARLEAQERSALQGLPDVVQETTREVIEAATADVDRLIGEQQQQRAELVESNQREAAKLAAELGAIRAELAAARADPPKVDPETKAAAVGSVNYLARMLAVARDPPEARATHSDGEHTRYQLRRIEDAIRYQPAAGRKVA